MSHPSGLTPPLAESPSGSPLPDPPNQPPPLLPSHPSRPSPSEQQLPCLRLDSPVVGQSNQQMSAPRALLPFPSCFCFSLSHAALALSVVFAAPPWTASSVDFVCRPVGPPASVPRRPRPRLAPPLPSSRRRAAPVGTPGGHGRYPFRARRPLPCRPPRRFQRCLLLLATSRQQLQPWPCSSFPPSSEIRSAPPLAGSGTRRLPAPIPLFPAAVRHLQSPSRRSWDQAAPPRPAYCPARAKDRAQPLLPLLRAQFGIERRPPRPFVDRACSAWASSLQGPAPLPGLLPTEPAHEACFGFVPEL
ncbi:proline-rich protein 36 [Triticum aestivum]|uniref:proline-rich protein 36 n=1 Tax=Triticum aestivum TaxID=4565 RepID=UPI001D035788|nr:proline-rich protein 36-like [Triticum aestivum]